MVFIKFQCQYRERFSKIFFHLLMDLRIQSFLLCQCKKKLNKYKNYIANEKVTINIGAQL